MEKNEPKHVYIFGNELLGFHGHSYDKEQARQIIKYRKGLKKFKIKNDEYCKNNLSVNTEFLSMGEDIHITADEEEYFLQAFDEFKQECARYYIDKLIDLLKHFKFNDKEKYAIKYLIDYLCDFQDYIIRGQYEDDADSELYYEMFDTEVAMRWFIKNVLD